MTIAQDIFASTNPASRAAPPTAYTYAGADITWTKPCRYMRCQTAGVVKVVDFNGATITANFLAGETRFLGSMGIVAAGTTATGIEAMP